MSVCTVFLYKAYGNVIRKAMVDESGAAELEGYVERDVRNTSFYAIVAAVGSINEMA